MCRFKQSLKRGRRQWVGKEGRSLTSGATDPLIKITTRQTIRGCEIEIKDNGSGMTPEILARIREPMFTTKNFGTGLGIPAVEKILEQHGGGLDVWTAVGEGSIFTLWWPIIMR